MFDISQYDDQLADAIAADYHMLMGDDGMGSLVHNLKEEYRRLTRENALEKERTTGVLQSDPGTNT